METKTGILRWAFYCSSGGLQKRVAALEQERAEFIKLKQQLELEFNQKRAKFKELYLSKEGKSFIRFYSLIYWNGTAL